MGPDKSDWFPENSHGELISRGGGRENEAQRDVVLVALSMVCLCCGGSRFFMRSLVGKHIHQTEAVDAET